MNTEILTIDSVKPDIRAIMKAAAIIKRGGLVAFPTETVYGLGADAFNPRAVERIYCAKGRPGDNPLIVHIAEISQLIDIAEPPPEKYRIIMDVFWPGPLTVILKKREHVPTYLTGGLRTLAVRMPSNDIARALLRESGCFIAAPSANSSGKPSTTTAKHVFDDLNGKIELILDAGRATYGVESTVLDLSGSVPILLRPGAVTVEMLEKYTGVIELDAAICEAYSEDSPPKAPGMKYKHYSPLANVTVVAGDHERMIRAINRMTSETDRRVGILATEQTRHLYSADALVLSVGDRTRPETIASELFDCLRAFDDNGIEEIFAESFSTEGIGMAVMNRLNKAAGYKVITV